VSSHLSRLACSRLYAPATETVTRIKDFYDMWLLSREYKFEGDALARAIAATFARCKTQIPGERPFALTSNFADDAAKRQLWTSFAEAIGAELPPLNEVIEELAVFLMPIAAEARLSDDRL
jgi:hypothetical protein